MMEELRNLMEEHLVVGERERMDGRQEGDEVELGAGAGGEGEGEGEIEEEGLAPEPGHHQEYVRPGARVGE